MALCFHFCLTFLFRFSLPNYCICFSSFVSFKNTRMSLFFYFNFRSLEVTFLTKNLAISHDFDFISSKEFYLKKQTLPIQSLPCTLVYTNVDSHTIYRRALNDGSLSVLTTTIRRLSSHNDSFAAASSGRSRVRQRSVASLLLPVDYGLNLTSGMFLEDRHLSQHHSAYTSAWIKLKAASVNPLHVL